MVVEVNQKSNTSQETKASLFAIVFVSVFIFAQFAAGFQLSLFILSMVLSSALILWQPRVGLYAIVALTVFFERFYTLQPIIIGRSAYKLYPIDIFITMIGIALVLRLISRKVFFQFKKVDALFLMFLLIVTLLFAKDIVGFGDKSIEVAVSTWKNYVFYGMLYFFVPLLFSKKEHLIRLTKFFLGTAALIIVFIFIGIIRGEGLWTEYTPLSTNGIRILAFPHAYYLSLALIAALYSSPYWMKLSKHKRWFVFGILSLWIVGILGSLMRHLWLGLGISVFAMLWILPSEYRKNVWKISRSFAFLGFAALISAAYAVSLFPQSEISYQAADMASAMSERVVSIGDARDESIAWRGAVWNSAFHIFSQDMLLGTGFGVSVPVEIGDYREFVEIRNMHNSWLAMLMQIGFLGFGIFVLFLGSMIWSLSKKKFPDDFFERAKYVTIGVVLFQGVIFLSQPYLETNLLGIFFWLNLGVMRSLLSYEHSRNQ